MAVPVCLTMIVKNEEAVITRGFDSILPYITHYAICDTGSTDRTVEIIEKYMAEHHIIGKVFHHAWKNFGHNRTLSLEASREVCPDGWAWVLDADDTIEGEIPPGFLSAIPAEVNGISITIKQSTCVYRRQQLFRNTVKWGYARALHEYPALMEGEKTQQKIAELPPTIWNVSCREGARNKDPLKYRKDVEALMSDLAKMPNDPRTLFYLANSWRDAGNKEKALKYYRKRVDVKGGWDQEKYVSYVNMIAIETNFETKLELAWKAYEMEPRRLDVPFYMMKEALHTKKKLHQIYAMASSITNREVLSEFLFVDSAIYDYQFDDCLAIVAFTCVHYPEALAYADRALNRAPESEKPRINALISFMKAQVENVPANTPQQLN